MEDLKLKKLLLGTSLLTGMAMFGLTNTAYAQDTDAEEVVVETVPEEEAEEEKRDADVVVTGSRIKRDTFSSISPIQVIDFEAKSEVGLIDPVQILQTTESAAGQQIDSSFGGFVLDNGPGSETINIRGLGAGRTLVMMNSRRLAPAGVEGAPSQPSINLIPSSLVDRIDILLEGASSVYGSDAVAGVVNVILKKDFEGFDIQGTVDHAEYGTTDYNFAASYGKNFDRGFFGVGAEYDFRDAVRLSDRDFLSDCDTHYEIDENGNIRTRDQQDQYRYDVWFGAGAITAGDQGHCKADGIASRLFETSNTFGSIYGGTGGTNIGIPGYVDQTLAGVPLDTNGDGVQDFGFQQFSINGNDLETTLFPEQKRYNVMAYGEYTLEGDANLTPFFEAMYSKIETEGDNGTFQLFPNVGASNPFNPCGVSGNDCGSNGLLIDQALVDRWNTYQRDRDPNRDGDNRDARRCATFYFGPGADPGFNVPRDANGQYDFANFPGSFDSAACTPFLFGYGPGDFVGPRDVQPIVGVNGDRTEFQVGIEQTRLVGGFKGDLPFMNFGDFQDWSFEASLSHSISKGTSTRAGIRDDRLNFALGNDIVSGATVAGLAPCTTQPGVTYRPDVLAGCVPVNLFADSLYTGVAGDFATQAERDYLFDVRDFDTEYKQTVWNAFATGKVADLPAGPMSLVVGTEYRVDQISSNPDEIARDGLFFGFFSDGGAQGEKWIREAYAEVDIPVVADKPMFRQLDINLSGRVLEDEYYGGASVYAAKAGWRPVDSLLLKASYGTSFRSPNLRENFQQPQTGFLTLFDPCNVPPETLVAPPGGGAATYNPTLDSRDAETLARCIAEGLDPTTLGAGNTGAYSTEVFSEGSLALDPEESTSLTLGFSFEQPFTDAFDLSIGASYFDIKVENSVISPSAQFIINDCYSNRNAGEPRSPFCDRIRRDSNNILEFVSQAFINLNEDKVRGIDFNVNYDQEINVFDRAFDLSMDLRANHLIEVSQLLIGDNGQATTDEDQGEFGFAEWTGSLNTRLVYKDWTFAWFTRYVGSVEQDVDTLDVFSNALGIDTSGNGIPDTFSDTCGGPAAGDVNCRDVGFADDYMVHRAGITYNNDEQDWGVTFAVSNIFDKNPPQVDSSEVTAISNAPIGANYDLDGRKFFVQVRKGF